jgi:hypothetical protein
MTNIFDIHVLDKEAHIVQEELHSKLWQTLLQTLTGAKVTTMPALRTPVSTRPTGSGPWRGRCRGLSVRWVGGTYNPRLQAVWFHQNCHLYRWLSIPWTKAY